jgi:hypothetical protein
MTTHSRTVSKTLAEVKSGKMGELCGKSYGPAEYRRSGSRVKSDRSQKCRESFRIQLNAAALARLSDGPRVSHS